jgi:hypothetical protein
MTGKWSLPVAGPRCRSCTETPRANTWSSGRNGIVAAMPSREILDGTVTSSG